MVVTHHIFHKCTTCEHHDPHIKFHLSFSKSIPNTSSAKLKAPPQAKNQTKPQLSLQPTPFQNQKGPKHENSTHQSYVQDVQPTIWEIPEALDSNGFDQHAFEERLQSWRDYRDRRVKAEFFQKQAYALNHPGKSVNSTIRLIPYLHRTPRFQPRPLNWNVMVMVMADRECPIVNATDRLLATVRDGLQTQRAQVVAYLPHVAGKETCRTALYQALRSEFLMPMKTGQFHVISPPLQRDHGEAYSYATNGLDFAYAAEFGHQYSDLYLFLQAGSRLVRNWWINYSPKPPEKGKSDTPEIQAEIMTNNRDYAKELTLAYEGRLHLAEDGISHDLCYMNFVRGKQLLDFENPTAALFASSDLPRLSLALRSYLPYGALSVSQLLERYCSILRWEVDHSNAPLLLFEYVPSSNGRMRKEEIYQQKINNSTTYAYLILDAAEIPSWVKVGASLVGPQPVSSKNSFLISLDDFDSNGDEKPKKYWMTFVVPTTWRHITKGVTKGNAYVVECLRQLSATIKEHFIGQYNAMILVLVSGINQADIQRHEQGLREEFSGEIESGIMKLVQAPLDQYPTLHGLSVNFKDAEQRVRWRSKQNLDISNALFAAKGHGKYIMLIEDDSGFRSENFLNGIKATLTNLHRAANPDDSLDFNPRIYRNNAEGVGLRGALSKQGKIKISYGEKEEPALVELGHRELWSQIRFSFGYSGIMIHDEDALVFGMLHLLLYYEKPCDLLFEIADSIRSGLTKDHFLRHNLKYRYITHRGKISTLEGKVFSDIP